METKRKIIRALGLKVEQKEKVFVSGRRRNGGQ
jgi:hypothetical protein